jgi:hypothetical protein
LCYSKFSWILWIVSNYKIKNLMNIVHHIYVRDRPFNLQGGLWFFVSFRIFFSHNTRVKIFIFLSRKARNFFPEFNKRLYDKNSESDFFFFPPPKSEYFFQQHWESEYFFRKKTITPPPFKLNGRSLIQESKFTSQGYHQISFFVKCFTQ